MIADLRSKATIYFMSGLCRCDWNGFTGLMTVIKDFPEYLSDILTYIKLFFHFTSMERAFPLDKHLRHTSSLKSVFTTSPLTSDDHPRHRNSIGRLNGPHSKPAENDSVRRTNQPQSKVGQIEWLRRGRLSRRSVQIFSPRLCG
jgi:hypothetical protein